MRPIPVRRAVALSIVTLGVYAAVWGHRNAEDLHQEHDGFQHWRLLFWLGFVTVGITWGILALLNFVHLNHLRAAVGIPPHRTGTWAMVLVWFPLLNALAAYLWARYWNHSMDVLTGASTGPLRSPATAAPS